MPVSNDAQVAAVVFSSLVQNRQGANSRPSCGPACGGDPRSAPGLRMNDSNSAPPLPPRNEPHFPGTQYLPPHAAARHWPRIRHLPPQAPIAASPFAAGRRVTCLRAGAWMAAGPPAPRLALSLPGAGGARPQPPLSYCEGVTVCRLQPDQELPPGTCLIHLFPPLLPPNPLPDSSFFVYVLLLGTQEAETIPNAPVDGAQLLTRM